MTRDAFVIVDEVATAIEDQLASVDLDRLGMMRGMTVDDVDHAGFDQATCERLLVLGNWISPVAAPVDGNDDNVPRPPAGRGLRGDPVGRVT